MAATDNSKPYIPLVGSANDGWSTEDQATATCYCGIVQLVFVSTIQYTSAVLYYNHLVLLKPRTTFSRRKALASLTHSPVTARTAAK
jgi:hypothetical protein